MTLDKEKKLEREEIKDLDDESVENTLNKEPVVETVQSKYKWYHINANALPAKFAYFFECGRRIGYNPNLILFLTSIGLNKSPKKQSVGAYF